MGTFSLLCIKFQVCVDFGCLAETNDALGLKCCKKCYVCGSVLGGRGFFSYLTTAEVLQPSVHLRGLLWALSDRSTFSLCWQPQMLQLWTTAGGVSREQSRGEESPPLSCRPHFYPCMGGEICANPKTGAEQACVSLLSPGDGGLQLRLVHPQS